MEYDYILTGEGDFTNPDKTVTHVGPGDFCTMNPNQGHAIANTGKEDLVFMALILYVKWFPKFFPLLKRTETDRSPDLSFLLFVIPAAWQPAHDK